MKALQKLIGKEAHHNILGRVLITGVPQNTRTRVNVQVIDRGPGWDEIKQRYTGVRFPGGWSRGQNYQYGDTHTVRIENLSGLEEA